MGALDGPVRQAAAQAIGAVGATVTLVTIEDEVNAYRPEDGTYTRAEKDLTVSAVIEDADTRESEREDTNPKGEKKVSVPAADSGLNGRTPKESWNVEFGGTTWDVRAVDEVRSGDQVAVYELWVAK